MTKEQAESCKNYEEYSPSADPFIQWLDTGDKNGWLTEEDIRKLLKVQARNSCCR